MHSAGYKCITARTGNRCRSVVFVTCVRGSLKYTQVQWNWHSESAGCKRSAVVTSQRAARDLKDTPLAGLYQSFLQTASSWGPKDNYRCNIRLCSSFRACFPSALGSSTWSSTWSHKLSYLLTICACLLCVSSKICFCRRRLALNIVALQQVSHALILLSALHLFNNILSFCRDPPVLRAFNNTDVILRLPMGKRIRDIKWLSVWCRRFTVGTDRQLLLQLCMCVCCCAVWVWVWCWGWEGEIDRRLEKTALWGAAWFVNLIKYH